MPPGPLPSYYIYNALIPDEEDRNVEFKAVQITKKPIDVINRLAREYVNAFLNSEGGRILFGVEDNGAVKGLFLSRKAKDGVRLCIDGVVNSIVPQVDSDHVKIAFIPVYVTRDAIDELRGRDETLKDFIFSAESVRYDLERTQHSYRPSGDSTSATGSVLCPDSVTAQSHVPHRHGAFGSSLKHSVPSEPETACSLDAGLASQEARHARGRAQPYASERSMCSDDGEAKAAVFGHPPGAASGPRSLLSSILESPKLAVVTGAGVGAAALGAAGDAAGDGNGDGDGAPTTPVNPSDTDGQLEGYNHDITYAAEEYQPANDSTPAEDAANDPDDGFEPGPGAGAEVEARSLAEDRLSLVCQSYCPENIREEYTSQGVHKGELVERYVVVVTVLRGSAPIYFTSINHQTAYIRRDGGCIRLSNDSIVARFTEGKSSYYTGARAGGGAPYGKSGVSCAPVAASDCEAPPAEPSLLPGTSANCSTMSTAPTDSALCPPPAGPQACPQPQAQAQPPDAYQTSAVRGANGDFLPLLRDERLQKKLAGPDFVGRTGLLNESLAFLTTGNPTTKLLVFHGPESVGKSKVVTILQHIICTEKTLFAGNYLTMTVDLSAATMADLAVVLIILIKSIDPTVDLSFASFPGGRAGGHSGEDESGDAGGDADSGSGSDGQPPPVSMAKTFSHDCAHAHPHSKATFQELVEMFHLENASPSATHAMLTISQPLRDADNPPQLSPEQALQDYVGLRLTDPDVARQRQELPGEVAVLSIDSSDPAGLSQSGVSPSSTLQDRNFEGLPFDDDQADLYKTMKSRLPLDRLGSSVVLPSVPLSAKPRPRDHDEMVSARDRGRGQDRALVLPGDRDRARARDPAREHRRGRDGRRCFGRYNDVDTQILLNIYKNLFFTLHGNDNVAYLPSDSEGDCPAGAPAAPTAPTAGAAGAAGAPRVRFIKHLILVFENCGDPRLLATLVPLTNLYAPAHAVVVGNPAVLVLATSRRPLFVGASIAGPALQVKELKVSALSNTDGAYMAMMLYPALSLDDAQELTRLCGGLPHVIKIACKIAFTKNYSPKDLLLKMKSLTGDARLRTFSPTLYSTLCGLKSHHKVALAKLSIFGGCFSDSAAYSILGLDRISLLYLYTRTKDDGGADLFNDLINMGLIEKMDVAHVSQALGFHSVKYTRLQSGAQAYASAGADAGADAGAGASAAEDAVFDYSINSWWVMNGYIRLFARGWLSSEQASTTMTRLVQYCTGLARCLTSDISFLFHQPGGLPHKGGKPGPSAKRRAERRRRERQNTKKAADRYEGAAGRYLIKGPTSLKKYNMFVSNLPSRQRLAAPAPAGAAGAAGPAKAARQQQQQQQASAARAAAAQTRGDRSPTLADNETTDSSDQPTNMTTYELSRVIFETFDLSQYHFLVCFQVLGHRMKLRCSVDETWRAKAQCCTLADVLERFRDRFVERLTKAHADCLRLCETTVGASRSHAANPQDDVDAFYRAEQLLWMALDS